MAAKTLRCKNDSPPLETFPCFLDICPVLPRPVKLFRERLEHLLFIISMQHLGLEKGKTECSVIVRTMGTTSRHRALYKELQWRRNSHLGGVNSGTAEVCSLADSDGPPEQALSPTEWTGCWETAVLFKQARCDGVKMDSRIFPFPKVCSTFKQQLALKKFTWALIPSSSSLHLKQLSPNPLA